MSISVKKLRLIAWINVCTQISGSFIGLTSVAFANTEKQDVDTQSVSTFTKKYTVGVGESLESILKKFNISLDLFYVLNPSYRLSNKKLGVGDQINIPVNPLPKEIKTPQNIEHKESKLEENVAQVIATAGKAVSQDNTNSNKASDELQNAATSMLTNAASNSLQQWLGQYGHARVQLGVDKDFSLKNSQYDFLAPLVDRENSLFFLQNSLHRTDDRTQVNVGLGLRYFAKDYMLGGNTFWDYDISRGHSRAGVGLEYWRNYLKLSANNYLRLSDWQESKDLKDYDERAANGWDLRAEAYLPSYPQLGGKLSYEKYYGDEVALFGRDNLQKDPYAATVGVTYTPIPLVTLGTEHTVGQAKENDTKFSAQLNYRFGVPWAQQIDPHAVNSLRTLAGSRYDFVERNNNIVLEYKKNEFIKLSLPQTVEGVAGEKIWVRADIVSKYNLQSVAWNADAIIAGGGSLNPDGQGMVEITLPAYNANGINSYVLSAQATDVNNNQSNTVTTTIHVQDTVLNQAELDISLDKTEALANGQDQIAATVLLLDKNNQPIANQAVTLDPPKGATLSSTEVMTDGNGKATVNVTSMLALDGQITATLKSQPNKTASASIKFNSDSSNAELTELVVIKDKVPANGKDANEVKATVKDDKGNPLANQEVVFVARDGGVLVNDKVKTNALGVVVVGVTNTKEGPTQVEARINNSSIIVETTFTKDMSAPEVSELTVIKDQVPANGKDANEVKAVIKDLDGNLLANEEVTFTADNGGVMVNSKVKTNEKGEAIAAVTNTVPGETNVTATVKKSSIKVKTTFTRDMSQPELADLVVIRDKVPANGKDTNQVKAIIKDGNGNLLANEEVTFTAENGGVMVNSKVTTNEKGEAIGEVTNTVEGPTRVKAAVKNDSVIVETTFTRDMSQPELADVIVIRDKVPANGKDTNQVKAIIKDGNGNLLANEEVTFTAENGGVMVNTKVKTNEKGEAIGEVTNTVEGPTRVKAAVKNDSVIVETTFTRDMSQPEVADVIVIRDKVPANGKDTNQVKVIIKDGNGNLLENEEVTFTAENGGVMVNSKVKTNEKGEAIGEVTNTFEGPTRVKAAVKNDSVIVETTFTRDMSQPEVADVIVIRDKVPANGKDTNQIKAIIKDGNGNLLANEEVTFTAENGGVMVNSKVLTDEKGEAIGEVSNTVAGPTRVKVGVKNSSTIVETTFE